MTKKELIEQTKKLDILYIEDEEILRQSSYDLFSNFFHSITLCQNGQEGLDAFKAEKFDIIITDIAMPIMDGIEFIGHVRDIDRHIPIIVYSAWNNSSYMTSCINLNVDAYVTKPLQINVFLEVLEKIILQVEKYSSKSFHDTLNIELMKKEFSSDALTGLQSHNKLMECMDTIPTSHTPVMILIDIDEFHIYNELYGLVIGDVILVEFSKILNKFADMRNYKVFRMSGDEFVLYEEVNYVDSDKYENDLDALFEYLESSTVYVEGIKEPINFMVTAGVSFSRDNGYAKAGMALQEARRRGRRYLGYTQENDTRESLKEKMYWREEINNALDEKRVTAYYQSVVNHDETVVRYESLIRLKQFDDNGNIHVISPSKFLDFSKISRQYIGLTVVMIEESFKTMIEKNLHMSINLTFHDISNREINKLLHYHLAQHKIATRTNFDISAQVIFELLENPNHSDYDTFVEFVSEFKSKGVLITIDNFGLGFSNMSQMASLAPHYVKIDSSLIRNIVEDEHASRLVKAIVHFSQELGIKTIAEYVSSQEIFQECKRLNIDEFQGYYFSKPVPKDEIESEYI